MNVNRQATEPQMEEPKPNETSVIIEQEANYHSRSMHNGQM